MTEFLCLCIVSLLCWLEILEYTGESESGWLGIQTCQWPFVPCSMYRVPVNKWLHFQICTCTPYTPMHAMTQLSFVSEATTCHFALSHPTTPNVFKDSVFPTTRRFQNVWDSYNSPILGKAIDSKLPLRPPRALNCGMALKRQEMDHSKRKTKVPMMPIWKGWEWGRFCPPRGVQVAAK